jgi:hypothetical protein
MTAFRLPQGVSVADLNAKRASRRGKTSKARGASFEKSVAEAIGAWINMPPSDVFRTRTRAHGVDIGLSAGAKELFPFSPECKDHKTLHIPEWIKQAKMNEVDGLPFLLIFKQHRSGQKYVVLEFEAFMQLVVGPEE